MIARIPFACASVGIYGNVILATALLVTNLNYSELTACEPPSLWFAVESRVRASTALQCADKVIVVARYKEDVTWLSVHLSHTGAPQIRILQKIPSPDSQLLLGSVSSPVNTRYGNEATAYLRYIIDNYGALPQVVAFVHGDRYQPTSRGPEDVLSRLLALNWEKIVKMGFASLLNNDYGPMRWDIPIQDAIPYSPCAPVTAHQKQVSCCGCHFVGWKEMEPWLGPPPSNGTSGAAYAHFVVSADRIRRRPKEFYQHMFDWLASEQMSTYFSGRVLEHSWHVIFGEPYLLERPALCSFLLCDHNGDPCTRCSSAPCVCK